jgi:hypothetical protein
VLPALGAFPAIQLPPGDADYRLAPAEMVVLRRIRRDSADPGETHLGDGSSVINCSRAHRAGPPWWVDTSDRA